MRYRSWPILVLAFGSLILLVVVSVLGAARRARQVYDDVWTLHTKMQQSEHLLSEIRAEIHVSGIFVRDFLLDQSHLTADLYRGSLRDLRASMDKELKQLESIVGSDEAGRLQNLHAGLEDYWESLEPLFQWTPGQKMALSSTFLRKNVLPRRDAVLDLANEIRDWNEINLARQQEAITAKQAEFTRYTSNMLAIIMCVSVIVAGLSLYRIAKLENRSEQQRRKTEMAEQEMRRLSQQLVQAQEEERRSISRELHDAVGQMLTGLRMEIGRLKTLRHAPDGEFEANLDEAKHLAEEALRSVRHIALGLRPSMLDDLGLGPALEWQAREFSQRYGVPVTVEAEGSSLDKLPESHRTAIYRVVQEALTNCARHASARNIRIVVHAKPDLVVLAVQDDGIGFNPAERRGRGLGLIGIEERVHKLGGSVTIFSQPQKGTAIVAEIPFAMEAV